MNPNDDWRETCDGPQMSECCGARIKWGDICSDCGEHTENQCSNCEEQEGCPHVELAPFEDGWSPDI